MKKVMKLIVILMCLSMCTAMLFACDDSGASDAGTETVTGENSPADNAGGNNSSQSGATNVFKCTLSFKGLSCTPSVKDGVRVEGGSFVIYKAGEYTMKGDLSDGQVIVAAPKTEEVTLVFDNFTAKSDSTAPIYVKSADKVTIMLKAGTVNSLEDASTYEFASPTETKPNACIYSEDDLTIKGDGKLTVKGNYNNGIGCKNDLRIRGGNITVSAPNNILKGNDSVTVAGGANVTLSGGEDAIKTDNFEDPNKGFILINEGAVVNIECSDDALQADFAVTVDATAKVSGTCGGDIVNCAGVINTAEGSVTVTVKAPDTAA